jgi:hypothetical protein
MPMRPHVSTVFEISGSGASGRVETWGMIARRPEPVDEPYIGALHPQLIDPRAVANQGFEVRARVVLPLGIGGRGCYVSDQEGEMQR